MARCGCGSGCACAVQALDTETVNTTVSGTGAAATPYLVSGAVILVPDGEGPLAGENALKADALGLYVAQPVCGCSRVHAVSDPVSLELAASTTDSAPVTWASILYEEGGWSEAGGLLFPPDDTALYSLKLLAEFDPGTGSDAVLNGVAVDNATTGWAATGYNAPGLGVSLPLAMDGDMGPSFQATVTMLAAASATRTVDVTVHLMAHLVCGCAAPTGAES